MSNLKQYTKEGLLAIGTVWLLYILFREFYTLTTNDISVLSVVFIFICMFAIKSVASDAVEKYRNRTQQQ